MVLMLECVGRVADICDDKVRQEAEENAKAAVVGLKRQWAIVEKAAVQSV